MKPAREPTESIDRNQKPAQFSLQPTTHSPTADPTEKATADPTVIIIIPSIVVVIVMIFVLIMCICKKNAKKKKKSQNVSLEMEQIHSLRKKEHEKYDTSNNPGQDDRISDLFPKHQQLESIQQNIF